MCNYFQLLSLHPASVSYPRRCVLFDLLILHYSTLFNIILCTTVFMYNALPCHDHVLCTTLLFFLVTDFSLQNLKHISCTTNIYSGFTMTYYAKIHNSYFALHFCDVILCTTKFYPLVIDCSLLVFGCFILHYSCFGGI